MKKCSDICYFPFSQLLLQPTGVVSPCCWNQEIVLGTVPDKTIEEIWNDEPIRKLRREFIEGRPESCAKQMRHIGCHKFSLRDYDGWSQIVEKTKYGPRRLDLRLSGLCNLKCVMCDVWKQPGGVYDKSDFWDYGQKNIFPHIREIDVLGGEPFIQKETFKLIDIVSEINKDCSWAFSTNGHYDFNSELKGYLNRINIRWMMLSLDAATPKTYKDIRNGDFIKARKTLDRLVEYRNQRRPLSFSFLVSMCVQQANWREVPQFLKLLQECGTDIVPTLQFAYQPSTVSILTMEKENKLEFLAMLKELAGGRADIVNPILLPLMDNLNEQEQPI